MTTRPLIFISAVSRELHSARQLVANTVTFLGYEPVWQDIFGTETGDLRELLRNRIDQCQGLIQLVGKRYGKEPPDADAVFGRISYSQYEALYARSRGKRVWYLFIDEKFPIDPCEAEPEELHKLQADYRNRLRGEIHIYHSLTTTEGLEASVLKLRDDLTRLRRGARRWVTSVTSLLVVIAGLVVWQLRSQTEIKAEMAKLREGIEEYPQVEAQVRRVRPESDSTAVQERTYAQLGKQLGVDPKVLREKLPRFADEVRNAPNINAYERANASYVAMNYIDAERFALQAATEAQQTRPVDSKRLLASLALAGLSAHRAIQYDRAMDHFRKAEVLTDRDRNLEEWVTLQHEISGLLVAQGKYADAEKLIRNVIEVRARILGPEHPDALDSRDNLVYTLSHETKYAEAEAEARNVLKLREKVLGPEHIDTNASRYYLADVLVSEGKRAEAELLYREMIPLFEKALGVTHPSTLSARLGLATALGEQGKNVEAEPLYREVIRLNERVYGPEHPNTLYARQNLATTLQAEHKYPEAEAEYRDVIAIQQKVIGPEHPNTLIMRNNLADLLDEEGKFAEAEAECRQIIGLEEKTLGPEDIVTLNSRGNLAVALIGQSKFADAEVEYKDVLKLMERVLGFEHPDTLGYTTKFATGLSRQNKPAEAMDLARGAEERARKILGPDNPATQKYARLVEDLGASPNK